MYVDGQAILGYELPNLDGGNSEIPMTPNQLEKWLTALPILNIKQLAYELPKYIQELNRTNISDKQRLNMLEQLRPIVNHIYGTLTKRFRGSNLRLSKEYQEIQWLLNVLIAEMANGYKRLLFAIANRKPGWFKKGHYVLLAQRTLYYLGERICLSYLLSVDVPR